MDYINAIFLKVDLNLKNDMRGNLLGGECLIMNLTQTKIVDYIDQHLMEYQELAHFIHEHPEVSNYEFKSSKALADQLRKTGFTVRMDVASHRTAFDACYRSVKTGPTVVFLAEYDALPKLGHACGHNLNGVYSLLAAIALKEVVDAIGGEIRVYGTPGEEGGELGSSKGYFVDEGFFDDVDAALCMHAGCRWTRTVPYLANAPMNIKFTGTPSHAAAYPEKGRSALAGVIETFNGLNAMRAYLPKDANVHGIITDGGEFPNIIPEHAAAQFFIRAFQRKTVEQVYQQMEKIAQGAALATGTTVTCEPAQHRVDNQVLVPAFDELAWQHIGDVQIPDRNLQTGTFDVAASSDVGNVSQVVPTIQLISSITDDLISFHTEEFAQAADSKKGLDSIAPGAKLLALTAYDLLVQPATLQVIKDQWQVTCSEND